MPHSTHNPVIRQVRHWVNTMVVGLNLCPFARREVDRDRIRYQLSEADQAVLLLTDIESELVLLTRDSSIETSLLILTRYLRDFDDFNQFLDLADALLVQMNLDGIFQFASFHPDYQFADSPVDDVANYTNRAPWPILHILREDSIASALQSHTSAEKIPEQNIRRLRALGEKEVKKLLDSFDPQA